MHAIAIGAAFGTGFTFGFFLLGILILWRSTSPLTLILGIALIIGGIILGLHLPGWFGYPIPFRKFFKRILKRK